MDFKAFSVISGNTRHIFVLLVVLLHKSFQHTVIVGRYFGYPVIFEKQEVFIALNTEWGGVAPILQYTLQRLVVSNGLTTFNEEVNTALENKLDKLEKLPENKVSMHTRQGVDIYYAAYAS